MKEKHSHSMVFSLPIFLPQKSILQFLSHLNGTKFLLSVCPVCFRHLWATPKRTSYGYDNEWQFTDITKPNTVLKQFFVIVILHILQLRWQQFNITWGSTLYDADISFFTKPLRHSQNSYIYVKIKVHRGKLYFNNYVSLKTIGCPESYFGASK